MLSFCVGTCLISVAWLLVFAINISFSADLWCFKLEPTGRNSSTKLSSRGSIIFPSEVISPMHGMMLPMVVAMEGSVVLTRFNHPVYLMLTIKHHTV